MARGRKPANTDIKKKVPKGIIDIEKESKKLDITKYSYPTADCGELIEKNMGIFSYNINLARAFPDIRDGLKPVARKALYSTFNDLKALSNQPYKKSTRLVGEGYKYYVHGDASFYEALIKAGQSFYINTPLIDISGNEGSISGDGPAAMRYVEMRLTKYAEENLENIHEDSVNWKNNYDDTLLEPTVLPVKYPNLLINGSYGIGQGYLSSIPPHNFTEVCDLFIEYIRNPDKVDLDYLANHLIPDYPTGGIIINKDEVIKTYKTGDGKVKIRGEIIHYNDTLILKSIPYMQNLGNIMDKLYDAIKEEKITGVSKVTNLTNKKNGVYVEFKIKKGVDPVVVENQLYKFTPIQDTLQMNLICTMPNGLEFKIVNIKEIFDEWLLFEKTTLKRIFNYRISKVRKRIHILEAIVKVLDANNIDILYNTIRQSTDTKNTKENVMKKFKFSELQAEYVIGLNLSRLCKMGVDDYLKELTDKQEKLKEYISFFEDSNTLNEYIINILEEGKKKYGKPRKTKFTNIDLENEIEATIPNTEHLLLITHEGFIKKVEGNKKIVRANYKVGLTGLSVGKIKEGDYIIQALNANNKDNLLCFTNLGRMFNLKLYNIKDSALNSYGYLFSTYLKFDKDERVVTCISLSDDEFKSEEAFLLFGTKKGMIKRSALSLYRNCTTSGLNACRLNEGDAILNVEYCNVECDIIFATKNGFGNRYSSSEISSTLRNTSGVRINAEGIAESDELVSFTTMDESLKNKKLLVITNLGFAKKVNMMVFPKKSRKNKIRTLNSNKRGEYLSKILFIDDEDMITIVSNTNIVTISAKDIALKNITDVGKKTIKLSNSEFITDVIN